MSTSEPLPGSAAAYARPWIALGVALIGFALTVVVLQTYPAIRPQMPAWTDWATNLLDLLVISAPLVAAVIVGAWAGAGAGADAGSRAGAGLRLAGATGIREWRLTDLVLGLGIGLVVRAVVELVAPTTGTLAGPLAGALPLGTIVVMVLGAVLVSPFVEEWFFRGLVLRALADALSGAGRVLAATVAIVVSTAAFSALHFVTSGDDVSVAQLIGTVGVGVGCGTLTVLTGRVGGAVAARWRRTRRSTRWGSCCCSCSAGVRGSGVRGWGALAHAKHGRYGRPRLRSRLPCRRHLSRGLWTDVVDP